MKQKNTINFDFYILFYVELLQNCDDAGAADVTFVLDKRYHGTKSLLSPSMAPFQGPALLQYDSARFEKEDFASIQKIGDGRKRMDPR